MNRSRPHQGRHIVTSLADHPISAPNSSNFNSVNPNDGTAAKTFATLTATELEDKLAVADACFTAWKTTTYAERAAIISKAASLLRGHVDEFAKLATLEMGKRFAEAQGEVEFSADILDYYAAHSEEFLQPVMLHPTEGEGHMEANPFGVLLCIEPWNFPYYQLARVAGPHLMAGNTVLVKHASNVPQCAIAFERLLLDAGAPVGAYTNLIVSDEQADDLIDDPRIKGVALTGSVGAGRIVAARAGMNLKKSSMELGGSDAFIVLDDADLARTIPWAVWGRMYNNGQTCCAAKRFIAVESIADEFLAKFTAALTGLKVGDPMDPLTTHGPMSSEEAILRLIDQIDIAVANGAKLVMGGKRIDRPGCFMETTILTDITTDNPAFRDEFFGPVVSFFRVADEDEAIALANDSDFGLGGSVFTRDIDRAKRVASRVNTGMMFINSIDWSDADLPFGGIMNSGYGRELGKMGIEQFVNWKLVRTNDVDAPQ
jgi:succinate-semialdehyde dehydrogenase/glutarate-semialdehyde dehydrogenase